MPDPRGARLDPAAVLDAIRRMTDAQRYELARILAGPFPASVTVPPPSPPTPKPKGRA